MRAYVIDFAWQVAMLPPEPDRADTLVVSLSPEASYELFRRRIPFVETGELCPHHALWPLYETVTKKSVELSELLDGILHSVDPRFAQRNWRMFDAFHYCLKIAYDQLLHHAGLLATLLEERAVTDFSCAGQEAVSLDEYGLFHPELGLFHALLQENLASGRFTETRMHPPSGREHERRHPRFSFGQPLRSVLRSPVGARLLEFAEAAARVLGDSRSTPVLSVGCKDLDSMPKDELRKAGIRPLGFRRVSGIGQVHRTWRRYGEFEEALAGSARYGELTSWRGIQFGATLMEVVRFFAMRAEDVAAAGQRAFGLLDRIRPRMVIFQTMAPFYLHNVSIRWWCEERGTPYAVWMHGGYGANYSLAGYDVVDYRLSERHISYGQVIPELLQDARCMLKTLGYPHRHAEVCGAPYFDAAYRDRRMPASRAARPVVMLAVGVSYAHNQFYFGYDRPGAEHSLWREHLQVLRTLVAFQARYEIILKDYPGSPRRQMWENMLHDIGADGIRYVSDGSTFPEVLEQSDLNVFPWISTTFFQALYSDADIFVLESGDLSGLAREALAQQVFLHDDAEAFCDELHRYLNAGSFCCRDKTQARRYFLDWDNRGDRAARFAGIVDRAIARRDPARGK